MMRSRTARAARSIDLTHLAELPDPTGPVEPAGSGGTVAGAARRRRRRATRLAGFASAVVFLGQCGGGGCAPTAVAPTPAAPAAAPAAPAAPAASASPGATTAPVVTPAPSGTPAPVAPAPPAPPAPTAPPGTGVGNTGNGSPNMDSGGVFRLIAPGGQLPSDAACAAAVRANPSPENRPRNVPYNNTPWRSIPGFYERATGNFTGSTDDIIRWVACKWGFDEHVLRAQAARESTGKMDALGVWVSDPSRCLPGHPIGANGRPGQCPGAVGIIQVYGYHFPQGIEGATRSTAYNLDLGIAIWRDCFEGREGWLGRGYGAGDMWGCVGRFYSGAWYDSGANWYINEIRTWTDQRYWTTSRYINDQGPSV